MLLLCQQVYDGIDATYPLFGTYCGDLNDELSSIPRKFGSSSNYLHIQFTSDATVTGAGVRALFLSAAGKLINDNSKLR